MSITTELREWMENAYSYGTGDNLFKKYYRPWFGWKLVLEPMLDNIDAEHEKAVDAFERDMGMEAMTDENMAKHGWVRLPVDADGVPWYRGSRVIDPKDPDGKVNTVWVAGDNTLITDDHLFIFPANELRHYHEPTVEDVLREFADLVRKERIELAEISDETIAEYAAKLRLAGEDE